MIIHLNTTFRSRLFYKTKENVKRGKSYAKLVPDDVTVKWGDQKVSFVEKERRRRGKVGKSPFFPPRDLRPLRQSFVSRLPRDRIPTIYDLRNVTHEMMYLRLKE